MDAHSHDYFNSNVAALIDVINAIAGINTHCIRVDNDRLNSRVLLLDQCAHGRWLKPYTVALIVIASD